MTIGGQTVTVTQSGALPPGAPQGMRFIR
jgi:hypothetical protein